MKYILASASPRRRELIRTLGVDFEICPSDCPEVLEEGLGFDETVMGLARLKAENVFGKYGYEKDVLVVGADTIVVLDNRILGKPKDREDAFAALCAIRGRSHIVYTGMCLISNKDGKNNTILCYDKTEVFMTDIADDEIINYIESGEPMDKAGSYGIQGRGSLFIERIKGNYNTVVGLNISQLYNIMKRNNLL